MKNIIIGNTGLIGKTICEKIYFDYKFNSSNINEIKTLKNKKINKLFLSCLPAQKYLINKNIIEDIKNIVNIIEIIKEIEPKEIILISTIDVYCESKILSNEDCVPNFKTLNYGSNRYLFEKLIKKTFNNCSVKIFRLPALFNKYIKKNILYDILNNNNIEQINANSCYQWYDLNDLYDDIIFFTSNFKNSDTYNLFTEPIETVFLLEEIFNYKKINLFSKRIEYNFKTKFFDSGYILNKSIVIKKIKEFVNGYSNK